MNRLTILLAVLCVAVAFQWAMGAEEMTPEVKRATLSLKIQQQNIQKLLAEEKANLALFKAARITPGHSSHSGAGYTFDSQEMKELQILDAEQRIAGYEAKLAEIAKKLSELESSGNASGKSATKARPDEFVVEEFEFVWTVAKSGDVKLRVEKTRDTSLLVLTGKMERLSMTIATAEAVAAVLAKADAYYETLRGEEEKRESLEAGDCRVIFSNHPKYGFAVSVAEKGGLGLVSVSMTRQDAITMAVYLAKARRLVEFINRKVAL